MKITLNWLRQYVDFDGSPEDLAERLTMLGLEVEHIEVISGQFEGIVVGQVLTRNPVPNSDKLSVCKVLDGQGERTIICGASNHQPGDKVALILPNHALPLKPGDSEPFVIKERKVFGFVSQGMMCSPQELGLDSDADGLLILRPDATVGQPFAQYLGRPAGDVLFDLEITPNRPDLNSVIGIAREISAATGNPLKIPALQLPQQPDATPVNELLDVRVLDPELCPRYVARVIKGVRVGPSPDWLRSALEKVGVRSISNVVDVTNYVMLETGQPLHAFDFHLVSKASDGKPAIVVRRANPAESFVTLDNQKHSLAHDNLLIADEQKGIALAGVMGGLNTEIHDNTTDVLIESACFNPSNIRKTSKALGLRTESSYRFERGADAGITDWASQRCAQLILETAGGQLARGAVDTLPAPITPVEITLRHQKVTELLGIPLRPEEIEFYLGQLGLNPAARKPRSLESDAPPEPVTFRIPTFRVDLKREIDLIEEVARLHGLDKIPPTFPRSTIGFNEFDTVHDQIAEARGILTALGLDETQGQTLLSSRAAELASPAAEIVHLANPLSSDMDVLRPSLLPCLLDALRHNVNRQIPDLALFEIGRVFVQPNHTDRPSSTAVNSTENRRVAIAITGNRIPPFWSGPDRDAKQDAPALKGLVEEFLDAFGLRGFSFTRDDQPPAPFLESASISLGGRVPLGRIGQLNPITARYYDLRDPVFLADLDLDQLLARRNTSRSFKPLPHFPSVRRDVAMLVPESVTHESVLKAVKQAKAPDLEQIDLFDIFRGKNIPEGQKSMAYALTYRSSARTLTDAEVTAAHQKVLDRLRQSIGATIRE